MHAVCMRESGKYGAERVHARLQYTWAAQGGHIEGAGIYRIQLHVGV